MCGSGKRWQHVFWNGDLCCSLQMIRLKKRNVVHTFTYDVKEGRDRMKTFEELYQEIMEQELKNGRKLSLADLESNAPVGSSANTSLGLVIIALAEAILCFCPPDT